jgi:hypothetical protein
LISANFNRIAKMIKSNQVLLLWLGMPCQSWSRARRNDGLGPPPLRDDKTHLFGLPNLARHDRIKVEVGNRLLDVTMALIRLAIRHNVPIVLENPASSRAWLTPQVAHLMTLGCKFVVADYCQYGQPLRKPTGFLTYNLPSLSPLLTCTPHNGRCSATNRAHIALKGTDASGVFLTLRAQPYPAPLCDAMSRAMANDIFGAHMSVVLIGCMLLCMRLFSRHGAYSFITCLPLRLSLYILCDFESCSNRKQNLAAVCNVMPSCAELAH